MAWQICAGNECVGVDADPKSYYVWWSSVRFADYQTICLASKHFIHTRSFWKVKIQILILIKLGFRIIISTTQLDSTNPKLGAHIRHDTVIKWITNIHTKTLRKIKNKSEFYSKIPPKLQVGQHIGHKIYKVLMFMIINSQVQV